MTSPHYRILLVEDDPDDRLIVEELLDGLEHWRAELVWAASYDEGVRHAAVGGFDVALVDYRLGARRGDEFAGEPVVLRSNLPVIILTSQSGSEADLAATAAGAADFLSKRDLDSDDLERTIRFAVENRRRHRSEARFRAVIENSRDLISILGADGSVQYMSPSLIGMIGAVRPGRTGVDAIGEVHPDDAGRVHEQFAHLGETPDGTIRLQYRVRHQDGSWRVLDTSAHNLLHDPMIGGVVVNSWDITELHELEEQLRQAQKMEAVGRLAGGIAHDFNNVLTAIKGHARMLMDDLPPESPHRDDSERIHQAAERAASLTRQLLAFSRKQVLEVRRVDLGAAALDMEPMIRRLIPERVELRIDGGEGRTIVRTDPGQLNQVVLNLVVNAVDAIEGSGSIRLSVDTVSISPEAAAEIPWAVEPGPYARLSVVDTGVGMPQDVIEHIFEPFYTTKPQGKGTGLGLATVYGIVKQSGGHILVESTPGGGTTFRVLLPRTAGEPDRKPEQPSGTGAAARLSGEGVILLVEDDQAVRALACRILERAGYTLLQAPNGREALDLAERHRGTIDLVLSDVVMPEIGGVELEERLRKLYPDLRVILTSGYSEAELRGEVRQKGAGFVPKPFTPEMLLRAVSETLARGSVPPAPQAVEEGPSRHSGTARESISTS